MPVYNGETYLAEAVESVLGQTLEDLELVAVDDGSQDGSRAILEEFAATNPRVRLLANDRNLGIAAALNRGWRAAKAQYVAVMHADDVALPERLLRQAEFLDDHRSTAVVGGAATMIDADGRPISSMRFPTASGVIRATLLQHNCLAHPSVMIRREALEAVGGYRFDIVDDYDLWLRLADHYELANLPESVILYRLHPGQLSVLALEEKVPMVLAVRAAARIRRASGDDPLTGVQKLTPDIVEGLNVDRGELTALLERELLTWATLLADLGHREDAEELVARASRTLGSRATSAFAAAKELRRAEALLSDRRPVAAVARGLVALRHEPRYASARLVDWLRDRLRGRGR
jgi:hypothetical protein